MSMLVDVIIEVKPANQLPPFYEQEMYSTAVAENSRSGSVVMTISARYDTTSVKQRKKSNHEKCPLVLGLPRSNSDT